MAVVMPGASRLDKQLSARTLIAASFDASRGASTTSVLPSLDGSFPAVPPLPDKSRRRRVSSEADPARRDEHSYYDRSEISSAKVSHHDKFASLAQLATIMSPNGMEARAKTAHHDAIVQHFQLRRVSGDASRASYAKDDTRDHEDDGEDDDLSTQRGDAQLGTEGSLSRIFAQRRILQIKSRAKSHRDSINDLHRGQLPREVEVSRGALCRRLIKYRRRAWRAVRLKALQCLVPASPTGSVARLRGIVVLTTAVIQLFFVPLAPVYFPCGSPGTTALAVFVDAVYLLDLFLSFNTAFYDEKTDRLELSRRKIFKRFLLQRRKQWVALDVLSAVPVDVLLLMSFGPSRSSPSLRDAIPILLAGEIPRSLLRALRCHSLVPHTIWGVRVLRVTTQLPLRLSLQRHTFFLCAARIVMFLLLATHCVACLWRLVVSRYDPHDNPHDVWTLYLADLTTAAQFLFGHFGQPSSLADSPLLASHESVFSLVATLLGVLVAALITSKVALLLLHWNANSSRYQHKLASVFATMDKMQLPRKLRQRVHQYYDHLWVEHDATDTAEIAAFTSALSPSLALEVNLYKYMDLVLSVPFWRTCSADFVTQIMVSLRVRAYLPEDYIMRQGEIGDDLFLINHGVCELRARVEEDGKTKLALPRVRRLAAGAAFGELALLMNYRRTATVRALTFVEMCVLGRAAFQKILTRYRDDRREVLREILLSCIEKKTQRFVPFPYEELVEHATGLTDQHKAPTPWEAAEVLVDLIHAPDRVDESVAFGFRDLDFVSQQRLQPVANGIASLQLATGATSPPAAPPPTAPTALALASVSTPSSSDSTIAPPAPSCSMGEIVDRLHAMEQWQTQTTDRLAALERGMETMLSQLARLSESLATSPGSPPRM